MRPLHHLPPPPPLRHLPPPPFWHLPPPPPPGFKLINWDFAVHPSWVRGAEQAPPGTDRGCHTGNDTPPPPSKISVPGGHPGSRSQEGPLNPAAPLTSGGRPSVGPGLGAASRLSVGSPRGGLTVRPPTVGRSPGVWTGRGRAGGLSCAGEALGRGQSPVCDRQRAPPPPLPPPSSRSPAPSPPGSDPAPPAPDTPP